MSEAEEREVLLGISASPGVAVGPARVVGHGDTFIVRRVLLKDALPVEVERLHEAIEASRREIEETRRSLSEEHGDDYALILEAYQMMHRDELLVNGAARRIEAAHINAEWALRQTIDALKAPLLASDSGFFRERASDLEHVGQNILRHLQGEPGLPDSFDEPVVLVAADLGPADAARLFGSQVRALITTSGSATSHTAILARALEIPAIVGVRGAHLQIEEGAQLIVDGLSGHVVLGAPDDERELATLRAERFARFRGRLLSRHDEPTITRDGVKIELLANLELPEEVEHAVARGAAGVGLYRSEFIYLDRERPPSEEEQLEAYVKVVRAFAPLPVVFRTFDLGGDKLPRGSAIPVSRNPALGKRAIRLSLSMPELFRVQLRAILRAAAEGNVRLMFPLISSVDEIRKARALVEECAEELSDEGLAQGEVSIGTMIEVPSAALIADLLAEECDFFSVGTNDLVQYTVALDRNDPEVAHLARPLHPGVLRLLEQVARAAHHAKNGLAMCGDMASHPLYLPIVLGLGFREISVSVATLPIAREIIRRIDASEATALAVDALRCATADDVEALAFERLSESLGDLWEERGIA